MDRTACLDRGRNRKGSSQTAEGLLARGPVPLASGWRPSGFRGDMAKWKAFFGILEGDIMDRLDAMSTFLTVVEQGSLSAAARRLKTPLTTVSRNVSELESHLQTKLFNRSNR